MVWDWNVFWNAIVIGIAGGIVTLVLFLIKRAWTFFSNMAELYAKIHLLIACDQANVRAHNVLILAISAVFDKVFYDKVNGRKAQAEIALNELIYEIENKRIEREG